MGVRFTVRLTPRGGRDAVEGWTDDPNGRPVLKARVSAAPSDGEANAALVKLLAKTLGLPKSGVVIVGGLASRMKTVEVEGVGADEIAARLGGSSPAA